MKLLTGEDLAWLSCDLLEKMHGQCFINQVLNLHVHSRTHLLELHCHRTKTEIVYNATGNAPYPPTTDIVDGPVKQ